MCRLLAGLQRRGHHVRFFVGKDEVARRAEGFGLDVRPLPVGGDLAVHHAWRVARALRAFQADVLVVGTFRKLLHLTVGGRLARVPVVARIGLQGDEPRNAKYRFLFRHWVDRVVVSSETMKDAYLHALPELGETVRHIPKGIQPPAVGLSRRAFRATHGIPEDAVVVTGLARLVGDKRMSRFVDVVRSMPAGVVGLVAGGGPLRAELERHALESGAPVTFLGHVDDVGGLLGASDVLLVTSRRESMSNAMLEAMALGVPVVSTPVDGACEVLAAEEGEDAPGVVTSTFETEDLVSATGRLVRDDELRRAMGAAAIRRVRERHDEALMVRRWEALLVELADERRRSGLPPSAKAG